MSWRAIKTFADSRDNYYVYRAGDVFPRIGKLVDEARIAELSTDKNAQGVPLIEAVKPDKEKATGGQAKPKTSRSKKKERG